jgi:hypothetical protein
LANVGVREAPADKIKTLRCTYQGKNGKTGALHKDDLNVALVGDVVVAKYSWFTWTGDLNIINAKVGDPVATALGRQPLYGPSNSVYSRPDSLEAPCRSGAECNSGKICDGDFRCTVPARVYGDCGPWRVAEGDVTKCKYHSRIPEDVEAHRSDTVTPDLLKEKPPAVEWWHQRVCKQRVCEGGQGTTAE